MDGRAIGNLVGQLQAWAGPVTTNAALLKFFDEFDANKDGILSLREFVHGLETVQNSCTSKLDAVMQGDSLRLGVGQLKQLAMCLDTNGSRSLSFMELARALRPRQAPGIHDAFMDSNFQAVTSESAGGCAELMFEFSGPLMRSCRLLDSEGHGYIMPQDFVSVVRTLGLVTNRPLSTHELDGLRESLGDNQLWYSDLLSSFEVVLDLSDVQRSGSQLN